MRLSQDRTPIIDLEGQHTQTHHHGIQIYLTCTSNHSYTLASRVRHKSNTHFVNRNIHIANSYKIIYTVLWIYIILAPSLSNQKAVKSWSSLTQQHDSTWGILFSRISRCLEHMVSKWESLHVWCTSKEKGSSCNIRQHSFDFWTRTNLVLKLKAWKLPFFTEWWR